MGRHATPNPKRLLRRQARAQRATLDAQERARLSNAICERVVEIAEFAQSRLVAGYWAFGTEADIGGALRAASKAGKRIALPRVTGSGSMVFCEHRPEDVLHTNSYGIAEPGPASSRVAESELDLLLVPGLAFDLEGFRLGYGGGYYDRALAHAPHATRVGIAFEAQLLPRLPREAHDLKMHAIATEARVITPVTSVPR